MTVAALYVERGSPYYALLGEENCWDKARDARIYAGPGPVIAHPDCGPWSKLRHLCTLQDKSCGPRAIEQVQEFGGVLEQPEFSRLWEYGGLPKPEDATDHHDGRTYRVEQVWWGHQCVKPTWLYVVGVDQTRVMRNIREARKRGGIPTHCVCTGPRQLKRLPVATKKAKRLTPPAFAEWLISLARSVDKRTPLPRTERTTP